MKRQQMTPSAIVEINIDNEYYVYAQILPTNNLVFFDYRTKEPLRKDFRVLEEAKPLFFMCVYRYVISRGEWLKVGKMPIREEFIPQPMKYIYDQPTRGFRLYNPNTGEIRWSTREECSGLEEAAVWEGFAAEDRIRDHYNGVKCKWITSPEEWDEHVRKNREKSSLPPLYSD